MTTTLPIKGMVNYNPLNGLILSVESPLISFNGKLWFFHFGEGRFYSSVDGSNWTALTSNSLLIFTSSLTYGYLSIYVLGGYLCILASSSAYANATTLKAFYTSDGLSWSSYDVPFGTIANNQSWRSFAALGSSTYLYNDLGVTIATGGSNFTVRKATNLTSPEAWFMVVRGGIVYAIPQTQATMSYGVYKSSDGITFSQVSGAASLPVHSSAIINSTEGVYLVNGRDSSNTYVQSTYFSSDFLTWSLGNFSTNPSVRRLPAGACVDGVLYVAGGSSSAGSLYDVWKATPASTGPVAIPL